jgi:hypothetical protein
MGTDAKNYSRLVFWLKLILGFSAVLLFLVIFVFSYSKKLDPEFKVVTKDVRIGLKYQARATHIIGNTSGGASFDFHAKALNPSHKNDRIIILSQPLGEIFFSNDEKFNFSSDFASLNLDEENILFNGNLSLENSWGTIIETDELVADFKRRLLTGSKPISAKTSFGSLKSGGIEYFYGSNKYEIDEEIFFTNGVKFEIFF